ncbi:MAG: archaeal heat shock protein Hsp20 [bacterium]
MPAPKTPPKSPPTPPNDPWANFPGGNPFGAGAPFGANPFGPGGPFGGSGDPMANMEAWFRNMGIDPNEFRKLVEEMQRNLQEAFKEWGADPSKSFVGGFQVKVGPDGKPSINTFGNKPQVKPTVPGAKGIAAIVSDEREPLTDVIDEGTRIAITMELPGVTRDDIDLQMNESDLEISVDSERRKYHKRVKLPAAVDPKTTTATYNNGVLDVTVNKKSGPAGGVKIKVK